MSTVERVCAAGKSASVSRHDLSGQFEKLSEDKSDSVPSKSSLFDVNVVVFVHSFFLSGIIWYLQRALKQRNY